MRIKILKEFRSPLTNKMTEINSEINVPMVLFWLKRIKEKDCEKIKLKTKPAAKSAQKENKKDSKKGSK